MIYPTKRKGDSEMSELSKILETIKPERLKEYLEGEGDAQKKIAFMKLDRVIKAFFEEMKRDGKEESIAIQYIKSAYESEYKNNIIYKYLISCSEEYIKYINDLKNPETRIKAMRELKERNLL